MNSSKFKAALSLEETPSSQDIQRHTLTAAVERTAVATNVFVNTFCWFDFSLHYSRCQGRL
jgi:hypothetical protein